MVEKIPVESFHTRTVHMRNLQRNFLMNFLGVHHTAVTFWGSFGEFPGQLLP